VSSALSIIPFTNKNINPRIIDQQTSFHEHEEMKSKINNNKNKENIGNEKDEQSKENYTRTVKNQIQLHDFNSKRTVESPRLVIGIISSHYSKKSIKICTSLINSQNDYTFCVLRE
jgi:hypothetical protein